MRGGTDGRSFLKVVGKDFGKSQKFSTLLPTSLSVELIKISPLVIPRWPVCLLSKF